MRLNYKEFAFPLNVYALALYLEEGHVDYLHYGLFRDKETGIREAQQLSTDLLLEKLPGPPCRILEIGIGLGTTLRTLAAQGYDVTGITPDKHQILIAEKRLAGNAGLLECISFRDFSRPNRSYGAIILQESMQYLEPLYLFNKAFDLLDKDGLLLTLDEVALKRKGPGLENFTLLEHLLAQAKRCGFSIEERMDLSRMAIPTLFYLSETIDRHWNRILQELTIDESELSQLMESLESYKEHYQNGYYGYAMLALRKGKEPLWRVTSMEGKDTPAMRALFETVFRKKMSQRFWEWKYGVGRGKGIIAWRDGKAVGHYGGMTRDILMRGRHEKAVFPVDVMVLPEERKMRGPFFLTAATFLERNIGFGAFHLLGAGFPQRRAMRVAELLGLYKEVGKIVQITWPKISDEADASLSPCHVNTDFSEYQTKIHRLWEKMAFSLKHAILVVRDHDYIHNRYLSHPEKHYDIYLVKDLNRNNMIGIVILFQEKERCRLMDVIGSLEDFSVLIKSARILAGTAGKSSLYAWVSQSFLDHFRSDDSEVSDLDVSVPTAIWTQGPSPESIMGRWWLTAGDTDFL